MIKAGERVETINFGWAEAITDTYTIEGKADRGGLVDVRFDNTGNVRKAVYGNTFKQGCMRDGGVEITLSVGQVWNTNMDGQIKIIGVQGKYADFEFVNTGNIYKAQKDQVLTGMVKDRPALNEAVAKREAEEKASAEKRAELLKHCKERREARIELVRKLKLERTVIKASEAAKRKESKEIRELAAQQNAQQKVENALYVVTPKSININNTENPKDLNIDFKDRDGKWVLRYSYTRGGTKEFVQTRLGRLHNNMTQRAKKGGSFQGAHGSYNGVAASEEFQDPQRFCDWAVQQSGWGFGYALEKDLLGGADRIYSAETCVFLPQIINTAIIHRSIKNIIKLTPDKLFKVEYSSDNLSLSVGVYPTYADALDAYKKHRASFVSRLAVEYRGTISDAAYQALILWGPSV